MSVVQIQGDFGIDHLVLTERARPAEPGPGEVLLRMLAASVNSRDLLVVQGRYNPKQPLPLIPCSDGAGEVVATGKDVTHVAVGDRVMTCFAQGWIEDAFPSNFRHITLGSPLDGTLAEYMLLHESGVVRAPAFLNDEEAATLPCAALTAWNAVAEQGDAGEGDAVVIQGTGGVALFALQFAAASGAEVVITSKSDVKLGKTRQLGASHTINYAETPEWSRPVKELTDGIGADYVIELGGSPTLRQSVRAVRPGGFIAMIGVLGGPVAELDLPLVVMRNVRLQGVTVGSRNAFERMLAFMERHHIHPVIDRVFAFEEAGESFRYLEEAGHFGKVCISVADSETRTH